MRICSTYEIILKELETLPSNQVLEQFKTYLASVITYVRTNYKDAALINVAHCAERHEPVRLLNEPMSRFHAVEQGFFHLYQDPMFKERLTILFSQISADILHLEDCLKSFF